MSRGKFCHWEGNDGCSESRWVGGNYGSAVCSNALHHALDGESSYEAQERIYAYKVHISHCCPVHGCKYGEPDCVVANLDADPLYPCEYCEDIFPGNSPTMEEVFFAGVDAGTNWSGMGYLSTPVRKQLFKHFLATIKRGDDDL